MLTKLSDEGYFKSHDLFQKKKTGASSGRTGKEDGASRGASAQTVETA